MALQNDLAIVLVGLALSLTTAGPSLAQASRDDGAMPDSVQLCANCHGLGSKQLPPADEQLIPRLGGQQSAYLISALDAYKRRRRDHFFMRGIAAGLTAEQVAEIASYYSARSATARGKTQRVPEPPVAARRCIACHGDGLSQPAATDIPVLAGQSPFYLQRAFLAYVSGGRKNADMQSQAADPAGQPSLSEQELRAVTEWFSSLPGGVFSR